MRLLLYCWLLLASAWIPASLAAEWQAQVNKQQLIAGETLELSLIYQGENPLFTPDLSALQPLFEIIASQQTTTDQQQVWKLTLLPKRSGELVIPALSLGNQLSQPIVLTVTPSNAPSSLTAPLTIEAQLIQAQVYRQAQALLKVRIFHQVPIYPDGVLSPLQLSNARVEPLGEAKTYEINLDRQRLGVIELNYAIFPQQAGLLRIPALSFSVTAAYEQPQRLEVTSAPLLLQVLPIPAEYPADVPWLPASNLVIEHQLLPSNGNILQGDPLSYQVTLNAQGLPSSMLPNFSMQLPTGFYLYPETPLVEDAKDPSGIHSQKRLQAAIIVNQSGYYSLPTPAITWWNTQTNQLQTSTLTPLDINVSQRELVASEQPLSPLLATDQPEASQLLIWRLISALLLLLCLLNFYLWRRARKQPAVLAIVSDTQGDQALQQVLLACQQNQAGLARQALDQWAKSQPETLHELSQRSPELANALDELNRTLYSPDAGEWQGASLQQALLLLSQQANGKATEQHNLPPLYPQ